MPDLDRVVGGLRCRDVLDLLSDFVDGELDTVTLARVNAHLDGCDTCEKFGADYAALVAQLRAGGTRLEASPGVRARLARRMSAVWSEEE
jgi:anti-sigma factor RsiW